MEEDWSSPRDLHTRMPRGEARRHLKYAEGNQSWTKKAQAAKKKERKRHQLDSDQATGNDETRVITLNFKRTM